MEQQRGSARGGAGLVGRRRRDDADVDGDLLAELAVLADAAEVVARAGRGELDDGGAPLVPVGDVAQAARVEQLPARHLHDVVHAAAVQEHELVADADVPGAGPALVVRLVGRHPPPFAGADDVVHAARRAGDEGGQDGPEKQQGALRHAQQCLFFFFPSAQGFFFFLQWSKGNRSP
jgi:hypothetical protein